MKSLKNLLIPAIVLVCLIVAAILVFALKPKEEIEQVDLNVLRVEQSDVESVVVTRKDKEDLTLLPVGSDTEGNITWKVVGDTEVSAPNQDFIKRFLTVVLSFNATGKLDNANEDLADYGLADPAFTLVITTKSSGVKKVLIGNETVDSSVCYFKLDDSSDIYTVSSVKKTFCDYDLINFSGVQNVSAAVKDIDHIVFERKGQNSKDSLTMDILCEGTDALPVFTILEPVHIKAGSKLSQLISDLASLEISSFVNLTDEEVEKVGLNDPSYHFTMYMNDGSTKEIWLTGKETGYHYGKSNFSDSYFQVGDQQITNLDEELLEYLDKYIYYIKVTDVKSVTGQYDGNEFEFKIKTQDSISSEDAEVYINGRSAKIFNSSGRCYAGVFYEALACIQIGEIDPDATPSGDPFLTLKFVNNDLVATTLDFIQRDSSSYYCMINGEYSGFVVYESELTKNGGSNTYDYGITAAYELLKKAIDDNLNGIYDIEETEG